MPIAANNATLFTMMGAVTQVKRNASSEYVTHCLNARIRHLIDARPYWADLGETRIVSIPSVYETGTVSVVFGSKVITGVSTAWPVNDVVDTNFPEEVDATGYVEVFPASMSGITTDSILYVDAAGDPEAVPVISVGANSFIGKFEKLHNAGATATQSSLVGRQFRMSNGAPIFTIMAVHSATELELDMAWGDNDEDSDTYRIYKCYYSLGADVRMIHEAVDQRQSRPLVREISQDALNLRDPQRMSSGSSQSCLVDYRVGPNGSMLYELWEHPTSAKQITILLSRQWPELQARDDRPPYFLDPQIIIDGATADVLRQKVSAEDVFFNPQLANVYEQKFERGMERAINADSARHARDFQNRASAMFQTPGSNWMQSHIPDLEWVGGGDW